MKLGIVLVFGFSFLLCPSAFAKAHRICGAFELFGKDAGHQSVVITSKTNQVNLLISADVYSAFQQMEPPVEWRGQVTWAEPNCACASYEESPTLREWKPRHYQARWLVGWPMSCWKPGRHPKQRV